MYDTIPKVTARRYILGRQGLWPGRRWIGRSGAAQALRYVEAVQIDPLNVVARSHDIVLWSRVADYRPEYLDDLLYGEREFFDYGSGLFIYPMDELPYWRVAMQRKGREDRWADFASQHSKLLREVKSELRRRGPLGNRDFTGRTRVNSYRARKDSGLALYYLWLAGELMTHHRQGFERLYDFRNNVAPAQLNRRATVTQTEHFFALKTLAFKGLSTARAFAHSWQGFIERRVNMDEANKRLNRLVAAGEAAVVNVEGWKEACYLSAGDLPLLDDLEAGRVPPAWQPLDTTTDQEVVFLAPLDIVSARGRANELFDFEYVWEVYKPAAQRRWGYYTLPILYGDQLVARLDPKLDRATQTLAVNGLWLEHDDLADEANFIAALARGLKRFMAFLAAEQIDLAALGPSTRRKASAGQRVARRLQAGI